MQLVHKSIALSELKKMSEKMFGGIVKAVVDVRQEIMMVDASMHADQEFVLLENGSQQGDLWGINLVPDKWTTPDFIVFDSMINLRPSWGNKSRGVDDPKVQDVIRKLVLKFVEPQ